jgi:two-component system, cell cycle sensor histidine kinase and response regulator CckA
MSAEGKTILVVEDDQETLHMLSRSLAVGGFNVLWARDASDALQLLDRYWKPIDLMLADVVLPGLSGPELTQRARERHPELLVVYVSAYDMETVRSHGVDPTQVPFLPKPYDPIHLIRFVREILDRSDRDT